MLPGQWEDGMGELIHIISISIVHGSKWTTTDLEIYIPSKIKWVQLAFCLEQD